MSSDSADLIERIIEACKAENPKFKEAFFRAKMQEFREVKERALETQPQIEESDGQPSEQKEIEDLEGIESEIYPESEE